MNRKLLVYSDGGARGNPGPAAYGFIVFNEDREKIHSDGKYLGILTNNRAEYSGVVSALKWIIDNATEQIDEIIIYLDSELIVKQLSGKYRVRSKNIVPYVLEIKNLERRLNKKIIYEHVRRKENQDADRIVNKVLDDVAHKR